MVLVVDENNEVDDYTLYSLGLKDPDEVNEIFKNLMAGKTYKVEDTSYSYDDILNTTFKLILPTDKYSYDEAKKIWNDESNNESFMKNVVDNGLTLKISGIIRASEDSVSTSLRSGVGYTKGLMEYIINGVNDSDIAKEQLNKSDIDVFTGVPFDNNKDTPITMDDVNAYIATLSPDEAAQMTAYISQMPEEQVLKMFSDSLKAQTTYATSFEDKEMIEDIISDYNKRMEDDGKDENVIQYTDYVGLIMSSVSTIISAISYVLIAFVAISLIVSSIMIGIITYISVLERTKEIGILRSIGASKKDISRVFNAETMIEGFVSGALGIIITLLLCIPANIIIKNLTTISNVAQLPVAGGVILVIISMLLTLIAGFIPAKMAAKKDPVVALRTE